MSRKVNRREFVAGTAAGLAAAAVPAFGQAPAVAARRTRPVVIASANGHLFKNGGDKTCVETAFARMTKGRRRARRAHRGGEHRRA